MEIICLVLSPKFSHSGVAAAGLPCAYATRITVLQPLLVGGNSYVDAKTRMP
ncbi:conserved hypothetical protein [Ricinus communis]|uniref:Uncharacterized protein n=1 Tax=Ricinus communis TaxID=3988 RepID=B9SWX0_RICCO|nr:conserved hypothetical protein [Ricinus communis]